MATAGTAGYNLTERRKSRSNSKEEEFFAEPLDLMRITIPSKDKSVPALHVGFMEPKVYVSYVPLSALILPCIIKSSQADEEEWVERMTWLEEDFTWLLKLPHHRFWSQVVYDENLQICLQTYLSHAPRCYEINFSAHEDLLTRQSKMHKLVFSIFLRMSTYKESKLHHITPTVFGDIVYNNFLFDIPRMMDLCVLYGFRNQPLISKMINNLFTIQPKYMEDLNEACVTTLMAFDTVEQQLQDITLENDQRVPPMTNGEACSSISSTTLFELLDIVNYITDISATLYMFLDCYPDACLTFLKHGAANRIPHFYDSILMDVQGDIESRANGQQDVILGMASGQLALSKTFFIRAFRNILCSCIELVLNAKCNNPEDLVHMSHLELYLQVTENIKGTIFKDDYNLQFPFEEDLSLFTDHGIPIDPSKIDHILDTIGSEGAKNLFNSAPTQANAVPKEPEVAQPAKKSITNLQDLAASLSTPVPEVTVTEGGATPPKPEETVILSLISNVQEILPLGDGFIESCLDYYNYDSEKVIDALLSDVSLPDHLEKLDRHMKRKRTSENGSAASVLDERKSVFDYDEFDIFHNESVPTDRVHFGKRNKTPLAYEVLGDSKESTLLKELTLKYGDGDDEDNERGFRSDLNLYEDEYDDTYDSVEFSVPEAEAELELLTVRPFTTPRVLASYRKDALEIDRLCQKNKNDDDIEEIYRDNVPVDEDEDDEENERNDVRNGPRPAPRRDDFCENPELQRQRYQQRREAQQQNRHRNYQPRSNETRSQPQNFKNKERHKGTTSNHNRRSQSDYKRSRGMFPS